MRNLTQVVPRLLAVTATLAILLSSSGSTLAQPGSDAAHDAAAPDSRALDGPIVVHDGRLTIKVHNMPLARLLQEIAQRAAFRIVTAPSVRYLVSADFQDVPLEEGLRRLLKDQNLILLYEPPASTEQAVASDLPARLAAAIVWPKGERRPLHGTDGLQAGGSGDEAEGASDASPSGPADMQRLARNALGATEPDERQEAVTALGHSGLAEAASPLMAALRDAEVTVRNEAVEALKRLLSNSSPEAFPRDSVVDIAARERNPQSRIAALEVLQQIVREWEDPSARAQLERAARDSDPRVRLAATRLLADLNPTHKDQAERR